MQFPRKEIQIRCLFAQFHRASFAVGGFSSLDGPSNKEKSHHGKEQIEEL